MTKLKILFLGAGKLWQLLRCFHEDALKLGIDLELHTMELDVFCPAADLATIHKGPKFSDNNASATIMELIKNIGADVVVPNMDDATVLLAKQRENLSEVGVQAVVSDVGLCEVMHDKRKADEWFAAHGDARPAHATRAPAIAKDRFGYASKGIYVLSSQEEFESFQRRDDVDRYLIQDYIDGNEYTVDAFVGQNGQLVDILVRKRLEVEAGIVLNSETEWQSDIIDKCKTILSRSGWRGPITIQFRIDRSGNARIIEINPRFGGGVTHSIHCGLRMPLWIMQERLKQKITHSAYSWPRGHLMTRARKDIFHDSSN